MAAGTAKKGTDRKAVNSTTAWNNGRPLPPSGDAWPVSIIAAAYVADGKSMIPFSSRQRSSGEHVAYSSVAEARMVSDTRASDVYRISRLTKTTRRAVRTAPRQRDVRKSRRSRGSETSTS